MALTDHDTLEGLVEARARGDELGVRIVAGCEVSCASPTGSAHVLCYFVGQGRGPLEDELERLRDDRTTRNVLMAERLASLGLPISYEEVAAEAGGRGIGRPHFAAVLVRKQVVDSVQQAFDQYLSSGAPGYVPKARLEVGEVIELARGSRALAVIAHPLSLGLAPDELERRLAALAEQGLAGLECYYGRYDPDTREQLVALARSLGLVATGGSDFHGAYKPDLEVGTGTGDLSVPDRALEELEARLPA
ncbi:MAG: hypothetical protein JWM85_1493 [Acidimicrobiaceae bacterium]|nr:hypothetical protein [Acidimicrobiaceae bacterium]